MTNATAHTVSHTTSDRKPCVRCQGKGRRPEWWRPDGGVCYRCEGTKLEPTKEEALRQSLSFVRVRLTDLEAVGRDLREAADALGAEAPAELLAELTELRACYVATRRRVRNLHTAYMREVNKPTSAPKAAPAPKLVVVPELTEESHTDWLSGCCDDGEEPCPETQPSIRDWGPESCPESAIDEM